MKIHCFTESTKFTGGRLILFSHMNALAERGHDVTIWLPGGGAVDWTTLRVPLLDLSRQGYAGLPVADICLFERRRFARPICKSCRGLPVHFCQGFEGVDVDVRLRRLADSPIGRFQFIKRWKLQRRGRAIDRDYALPTVKIVVQEHLRELLSRRYRQPVYVVPNGLPSGIFTRGEDAEREVRTVLVIGPANVRCKRIVDALAAVQLLKHRRGDTRLVRVSQHPLSDAERKLRITDEYHVLLPPHEMARQYRRATVLLFPSDETEGFGLPMLEAMACGTPLVATDIPAARAFDSHGDHGHFVPVGRPDLLARAAEAVLDDAREQNRLRRRGFEIAERYTRERSHAAMEATLREIVASQPRAAG
jgi:glycosyltransferase involved in cell wall biosynthesis